MANEYLVNSEDMTAVAEAIRSKGGTSDALEFPDGFVDAVGVIQAGAAGDSALDDLVTGAITEFSSDSVTAIRAYAFNGCEKLKSVNLPLLKIVPNAAFNDCRELDNVNLPSISSIWASGFMRTSSLEYLDVHYTTSMGQTVFYGCSVLKYLVIRSDSVCSIGNVNAFNSTPFSTSGEKGYCLVPAAQIESYQSATNWSTIYAAGTCVFLPLEEYTIDGTTTGEVDKDKVYALEASV